jgi:hypothetical protein
MFPQSAGPPGPGQPMLLLWTLITSGCREVCLTTMSATSCDLIAITRCIGVQCLSLVKGEHKQ